MTDQQPSPVVYPIIVSVFGRSEVDPVNALLIRADVEIVLRGLNKECGQALHVMTGTTTAADRIVAAAADDLEIPRITIVRPWRPAEAANSSVGSAEYVVRLSRPEPMKEQSEAQSDQALLTGILLESAHIVLSIGDEVPSQNEAVALSEKRTGALFRPGRVSSKVPAPMALGIEAGLDTETTLPWLQVTGQEKVQPGATPGRICILHNPRAVPHEQCVLDSDDVFGAFAADTKKALGAISRLNRSLRGVKGVDRRNFSDQLGYLSVEGVPDPAGDAAEPLERLRVLQSGADAVARGYQRWLLGVGAPARDVHDWYRQAKGNQHKGGWLFSISALLAFCLLVPAIVILFEFYSHMPHFLPIYEFKRVLLYIYVLLFILGALVYKFVVKRLSWQDQFQDYRVLAEALRVQLFWCLAKIPDQVGDHYLYKHRAELEWIRYALRAVKPWSFELVLGIPQTQRELVRKGWMVDQEQYYERAAERNHASAKRSQRLVIAALSIGLLAAVILAIAEVLVHGDLMIIGPLSIGQFNAWIPCWKLTLPQVDEIKHVAIIIMGSMPGIAAFFGLSAEIRAYEGHAQGYGMMRAIFSRALAVEPSTVGNDEAFRYLVFELGKEAINENAGWLMDHRHRPIENRVG